MYTHLRKAHAEEGYERGGFYMENLELVAAILASGVVAQKSSMSPEKAVDEAITAYTQLTAKLVQLEAKQKQLKNAA
jgi:outer membrane murein-binding lipoprotein Lpp